MQKLAGVSIETDTLGRVRKVTLDMKYHALFVQDYLDRLKIEEAKKSAEFISWDEVRVQLDKKHGINPKKLQANIRTKS